MRRPSDVHTSQSIHRFTMLIIRLIVCCGLFSPILAANYPDPVIKLEQAAGSSCPADHVTFVASAIEYKHQKQADNKLIAIYLTKISGILPSEPFLFYLKDSADDQPVNKPICIHILNATTLASTGAKERLQFEISTVYPSFKASKVPFKAPATFTADAFDNVVSFDQKNEEYAVTMTITQSCPTGTYGYLCQKKCECSNKACDVKGDGKCSGSSDSNLVLILAVVIPIILLLVIGVVVFIMLKKKQGAAKAPVKPSAPKSKVQKPSAAASPDGSPDGGNKSPAPLTDLNSNPPEEPKQPEA
ncbi:unnamed protein product, partial [Mesorhabditis spiculigera]